MTRARTFKRGYRDGERVKSVYVGTVGDPLVDLLRRKHDLNLACSRGQSQSDEELRRWHDLIDKMVNRYASQFRSLLTVWLRVRGVSVDRDGSWKTKKIRKRKGETVPVNMTQDDFDELVVLAERGNEAAEASLQQLMRQDPATWRRFGDLAYLVQKQLLGRLCDGSVVATAAMEVELGHLRERLRRNVSDPLRDLAIDEIVAAQINLQLQTMEAATPGLSRTMASHHDQRLARARRQFQSSIEGLAKIDRHLGLQLQPTTEFAGNPNEMEQKPRAPQASVRPTGSSEKMTAGNTDAKAILANIQSMIPRPPS